MNNIMFKPGAEYDGMYKPTYLLSRISGKKDLQIEVYMIFSIYQSKLNILNVLLLKKKQTNKQTNKKKTKSKTKQKK